MAVNRLLWGIGGTGGKSAVEVAVGLVLRVSGLVVPRFMQGNQGICDCHDPRRVSRERLRFKALPCESSSAADSHLTPDGRGSVEIKVLSLTGRGVGSRLKSDRVAMEGSSTLHEGAGLAMRENSRP